MKCFVLGKMKNFDSNYKHLTASIGQEINPSYQSGGLNLKKGSRESTIANTAMANNLLLLTAAMFVTCTGFQPGAVDKVDMDQVTGTLVEFLGRFPLEGRPFDRMDRHGKDWHLEYPGRWTAEGRDVEPGAYAYLKSDTNGLTYGWTNVLSIHGVRFTYASVKLPDWPEPKNNIQVYFDKIPLILKVEQTIVNRTTCIVNDSLTLGDVNVTTVPDGIDISQYFNSFKGNGFMEPSPRARNCENSYTPINIFYKGFLQNT